MKEFKDITSFFRTWPVALIVLTLTISSYAQQQRMRWGSSIVRRSHSDSTPAGFMLIPQPPAPSVVRSKLVSFEYFCQMELSISMLDIKVDLLILRPGPHEGTYTIVGHANVTGFICYRTVTTRINLDVEVGDVLGLGFEGINPIPYDDYGDQSGCYRSIATSYVRPNIGVQVQFTREPERCWVYSLRASYDWSSGVHPSTPPPPVTQYPIWATTTRYPWLITTAKSWNSWSSWAEANPDQSPPNSSPASIQIGYVIGGVILAIVVIVIIVCRVVCRQRAMQQRSTMHGTPLQPVVVPPPQHPPQAPGPRHYPTQSYPTQPAPFPTQAASPYPPTPGYPPEQGIANPAYYGNSVPPTMQGTPYPDQSSAPPPAYDSVVKDPPPHSETVQPTAPEPFNQSSDRPPVVSPPKYEDIASEGIVSPSQ